MRKIWFSRHGESEYNMFAKIGGDSNISPQGQIYAKLLPDLLVDRVPLVSRLLLHFAVSSMPFKCTCNSGAGKTNGMEPTCFVQPARNLQVSSALCIPSSLFDSSYTSIATPNQQGFLAASSLTLCMLLQQHITAHSKISENIML